jgi:hypothetical protein
MDRLFIQNRSASDVLTNERERFHKDRTIMGYETKPLTVGKPDGSIICLAEPCRTSSDGLEHRLQIGRRA